MTDLRAGILIPARLGSTRLERKLLSPIGDHSSALAFLVQRLSLGAPGLPVVVCTTQLPQDDLLDRTARELGVHVVRGSETDIVARFESARAELALDIVINVDGDDLFCSPDLCNKALRILSDGEADVVTWDGYPLGYAPVAFTAPALVRVSREKTTDDTATGWRRYFLESGGFRVLSLPPERDEWRRPDIRLTLDYPQDLVIFRTIERALRRSSPTFEVGEIITAFDADPALAELVAEVGTDYWQRYRTAAADKTLDSGSAG